MRKIDFRLNDATESNATGSAFSLAGIEKTDAILVNVPSTPDSRARDLSIVWSGFAILWACATLLLGYSGVFLTLLVRGF